MNDSGAGTAVHRQTFSAACCRQRSFRKVSLENGVVRLNSDDGRIEFTGCLHGPEGDVKDAAAAGPRVSRLAEACKQPVRDNQPLGRK